MPYSVGWLQADQDQIRQMQELAAAREKGHQANLELFQKMYLSIGPDVTKLERHRAELEEAMNLAGHRWSRLWDLEAEAERSGLKELREEARRERKALEALRIDWGKK